MGTAFSQFFDVGTAFLHCFELTDLKRFISTVNSDVQFPRPIKEGAKGMSLLKKPLRS